MLIPVLHDILFDLLIEIKIKNKPNTSRETRKPDTPTDEIIAYNIAYAI